MIVGLSVGSVSIALACVTAYNPLCGGTSGGNSTGCTDSHETSYCETTDTMTLCQNVDMGSFQTVSSGTCVWDCFYIDSQGVEVGCGVNNVPWNGTKPDGNQCPRPA